MREILHKLGKRVFQTAKHRLMSAEDKELRRLDHLPRRAETITDLLGYPVQIPDGPSFAAIWREVFQARIYEFAAQTASPRILDCGANVGLSVVFFKRLYPHSRVTAFEPDPAIFAFMQRILDAEAIPDVQAIQKGVWSSAGSVHFFLEGSDGGRIIQDSASPSRSAAIETVPLTDFLDEPVDFLKMDIEGAEVDVLLGCAKNLSVVRNIFVEYHSFADAPQRLVELLSLLRDAGFRVQMHPMMTAPRPYLKVQTHQGMDLQLNIFGFRTNRD